MGYQPLSCHLSKGYLNPNRKLGVTTHFLEIIKQMPKCHTLLCILLLFRIIIILNTKSVCAVTKVGTILNIYQINKFIIGCLTYQFVQNTLPGTLMDIFFWKNDQIHDHNTCLSKCLHKPSSKTNMKIHWHCHERGRHP